MLSDGAFEAVVAKFLVDGVGQFLCIKNGIFVLCSVAATLGTCLVDVLVLL